jgi:hypothetical protein
MSAFPYLKKHHSQHHTQQRVAAGPFTVSLPPQEHGVSVHKLDDP